MDANSNALASFDAALNSVGLRPADYPNLRKSIEFSSDRIADARIKLDQSLRAEDPPIDVVAFGSMARYEMTPASDFDYLVVAYSIDNKPGASRRSLEVADSLRSSLGGELVGEATQPPIRKPGQTGLFGTIVSAPDLVEVIGLERDTNHTHSRRILVLEESVSLYRPTQHSELIQAIVGRYLEARPASASGVPRFLLNDLARYWRTLSVDYQAKTPPPAKYSLRYLKLLISRKFAYASSVLPLFYHAVSPPSARDDAPVVSMADHLFASFSLPPITRLLSFSRVLRAAGDNAALEGVRGALGCVETFNELAGSDAWRDQIKAECASDSPREQPGFSQARELARSLQESLQSIFFSETMAPISQKYLIF
jgi:hypothetical protein